jgi:hypothetical protein
MCEGIWNDIFVEVDAIECHFQQVDILTCLVSKGASDSKDGMLPLS